MTAAQRAALGIPPPHSARCVGWMEPTVVGPTRQAAKVCTSCGKTVIVGSTGPGGVRARVRIVASSWST